MNSLWLILITAAVLVGLFLIGVRYFSLWLQAYVTGTRIQMLSLIMMSLRKVDPRVIVQTKIMAAQAGLTGISTDAIEAQYLAGGDVGRIILALIAAQRAHIELDWNTAAAIDLAGRDILEAVRVSVNPKVIFCPEPKAGVHSTLDGVSKDGIQLQVRALVTVRTNLSQLIGGAAESTVIARVGEGIVSAIGACDIYQEALADPTLISRKVIAKGLDSQTSFKIISIDIASIHVGRNIGAQLRITQANADVNIARAEAEGRRAMAVAREQEMLAQTQENQALVVLAEAQIPLALADTFREGRLHSKPLQEQRKPEDLTQNTRQSIRPVSAPDLKHYSRTPKLGNRG
ncbi:flotillin-like protein FloA [Gimesia panareensis]|uniref:flotillin-like protein FloA n=1 Tax=Gimesia panareensis TaxID=2527978 RepID=UPI0011A3CCE5|nr:flotillin-like protein FloA [Gimesia panareensis]